MGWLGRKEGWDGGTRILQLQTAMGACRQQQLLSPYDVLQRAPQSCLSLTLGAHSKCCRAVASAACQLVPGLI